MIWKLIVNTISLTRWFISPYVAILAGDNRWPAAFVLMAILLLTDAADGQLATKFSAQSFIGGKIIDPIGDLILCLGGLYGMFVTGNLGWDAIILLCALFFVIWLSVAMAESNRHKRVYIVLSRIYYLGVMIWVLIFYAEKAQIFQSMIFWTFVLILAWAAWKERHRLLAG